jgi:hypothetical protein
MICVRISKCHFIITYDCNSSVSACHCSNQYMELVLGILSPDLRVTLLLISLSLVKKLELLSCSKGVAALLKLEGGPQTFEINYIHMASKFFSIRYRREGSF